MMRPRRSFIMRRKHALERRNTEVRLVVITWSQSSGFIRSSSVSRVMAALLTRIVGISPAASRSVMRESMESELPTSRTAPWPLYPCNASSAVSFEAPSAVVEVPMTLAPACARVSAISWPIPLEAPVTNATSLSRSLRMGASFRSRQRHFQGCRILEGQELQALTLLDAPVQAGEHLTRPALDQLRDARGHDRTYCVYPAHGARKLADQKIMQIPRLFMGSRVNRADKGNFGGTDLHVFETSRKTLSRAAHQGRMHGDTVRKQNRALCPTCFRSFDGALHRSSMARNDDLAWCVEVRQGHHLALGGLATSSIESRLVEAQDSRTGAGTERKRYLHGQTAE